MKKFIVIYYATADEKKQWENAKPEDMKKGMDAWMAWVEKCGSGVVDVGAPLGNGQKVGTSGSSPSTKDVAGYSVLQAEDMDGAVEMLKGHPHLEMGGGCGIEVYEAMPHSM